jgi:LDH2 family malate/lactate/ureidoglycolate dehydrogenase
MQTQSQRFDANQLLEFATAVLEKAGAEPVIARQTATYLLEGDLLGFSTHGLKRLYFNAKCLADGRSRGRGDIEVLRERAALATWDAHFLPGPYVAAQAVQEACAMAKDAGTATIVVRRAQHVASLAAYLQIATQQDLVVSLMCATPAQSSVAPFAGKAPVFSPNPFAIGVPSSGDPLLLDMSFSMTAAGKVRQHWERKEPLPWPAIVTADGQVTTDPAAYIEGQGASILPLGGTELGYKGYGLCLFSEIWTLALSNYGRQAGSEDGESNSLFVQVLDPTAFGELSAFKAVTDDLLQRCRDCPPLDANTPVRIPGQQSLARRNAQMTQGVALDEATRGRLQRCAEVFATPFPQALS